MAFNFDYKNLNEIEAASILKSCWPLLEVLKDQGYWAALDEDNSFWLYSFGKLMRAGWFENGDVLRLAGLGMDSITLLTAAVNYHQLERLRELHQPEKG